MPRLSRRLEFGGIGPIYVLAPTWRAHRTACRAHDLNPRQHLFCPEAVYLSGLEKLEAVSPEWHIRVLLADGWKGHRHARALWDRLIDLEADVYGAPGRRLSSLGWPWPEETDTTARAEQALSRGAPFSAFTQAMGQAMEAAGRSGETAQARVEALIHAAYSSERRCPCRACTTRLQHTTAARPLPALGAGMAYVYCLDGPLAGEVRTVPSTFGTLIWREAHYRELSVFPTEREPVDPVYYVDHTYHIEMMRACDLVGFITGSHPSAPELCNTTVRVAAECNPPRQLLLTPRPDGTDLALRAADALVPRWRDQSSPPRNSAVREELIRQRVEFSTWPVLPHANSWSVMSPFAADLPRREPSPAQLEARRVEAEERTAQPYRPYEAGELNWPSPDRSVDYGSTCAHICGDDHRCDARATTSITYTIPSGGKRTMPVCAPCYAAEQHQEGDGRNDDQRTDRSGGAQGGGPGAGPAVPVLPPADPVG